MRIVYVSKMDGFFKTRIQKEKKTISLNQFAKKKPMDLTKHGSLCKYLV